MHVAKPANGGKQEKQSDHKITHLAWLDGRLKLETIHKGAAWERGKTREREVAYGCFGGEDGFLLGDGFESEALGEGGLWGESFLFGECEIEGCSEVFGGLEALFGLFGECAMEKGLEFSRPRDRRASFVEQGDGSVDVFIENTKCIARQKGRFACERLKKHDAQGVQVRASVSFFGVALDLFGRHVQRRAKNGSCACEGGFACDACDAKVEDLGLIFFLVWVDLDKDIFGFEIAMDDVLAVNVIESRTDLLK